MSAELIRALRDTLKATQFGLAFMKCPLCAGWNVGPNGETSNVHTKECTVAEMLRRADEYLATPPPQPSVSEGSVSADIEWTDTRDGDAPLVKLAAMLQALEMEPAAVNLSAQQLAVICRGITKVAKRASTQPPQPSVSEGSVPELQAMVLLLRTALEEAMDWNWLDDDARPSGTATFCDAAMRSVDAMLSAAPSPTKGEK